MSNLNRAWHPADAELRRKAQRQPISLKAHLAGSSGKGLPVRLLDISTSGLLMSCSHQLDLGAELSLDLPETQDRKLVIQWRSGNLHGCQFDTPLPSHLLSSSLLRSEFIDREPRSAEHGRDAATSDHTEAIGFRIARLRKLRNWTQSDLANALGVSKTTICNWETGRTQPRQEAIELLSQTPAVIGENTKPRLSNSYREGRDDLPALLELVKTRISQATGANVEDIVLKIEI